MAVFHFLAIFCIFFGYLKADEDELYDRLSRKLDDAIADIKDSMNLDIDRLERRIESFEAIEGLPELSEKLKKQSTVLQSTLATEKAILREAVDEFQEFQSDINSQLALMNDSFEQSLESLRQAMISQNSETEATLFKMSMNVVAIMEQTEARMSDVVIGMEKTSNDMLKRIDEVVENMQAGTGFDVGNWSNTFLESGLAEITKRLQSLESEQERCGCKKDFWIGPITSEVSTKFVNFTLASGQLGSLYEDLRDCAEASTDNRFIAVRVGEDTEVCEALTWDWGSEPRYDSGYTYLRKTKTIESYQPAYRITNRFQWLLPGTFGVGGSMELYITIPADTRWKAFEIMVVDTTEYSFATYEGEPEVIMVYAQIERQWGGQASVHFKVWINGWANQRFIRRTELADGNPHKFSFVPQSDVMQIFIDEENVLEYTHYTDPATAKQLSIDPYDIPAVQLHNVTFVGV